ncbi:efflux transporter outer membrane subunit [Dyella flava]|uniref:Efflux transporter outer membrane subunit n=1 Tax=Dyella flava TaxID=1920170 RepID=A0ABS2K2F7_9GAMM|nr:efflux transporter outer membrane subunit [Dyella flava]MBM7124932.1 efflux transporter outer membrane subunit [Dyella flava]
MRVHLLAAAVGMTLALAACASSGGLRPDGTPINPNSLKSEQSLPNVTVSPAAWPQNDWWKSLGDPQLNSLIAEALQDNPTLAEADARAREAQAESGIADSARKPTVNVGGSVQEARIPTTIPKIGNGHNETFKYADVSFNWNLDLWGGERAAWQAALGQQRATEVDAQAARIELSANVARAYVQLGYAYEDQDVSAAELKRASDVLALTQQRVNAGIDNDVQLKQSVSEVAAAQGEKAFADREIDAARSALSVLLGKGPDRGIDIARPTLLPPNALDIPADLPVELLGHRADLVAARWRVEASAKDIKSAKTQFLPNVNISALAGMAMVGGGNLFQGKSTFYDAGPAFSLPIFDGGRRRSNLDSKDAEYDLAVAKYNETLVRAVNEVSDDNDALASVRIQIGAQQRAVDAASDAWTLAEQRYQAGIGSYLEALSVRQELLVAQKRMAELHAQQADTDIQLIQALGGGYRPNQAAPDAAASAAEANSRSLINHS